MRYLVTHGERNDGADPGHTSEGLGQIRSIKLPKGIAQVVVGTGRRHWEVNEEVAAQLPEGVAVKTSPHCGSADSLNSDKTTITLSNGKTVKLSDYIGIETSCFDAWEFIESQPDGTLFCAGGELMMALGCKAKRGKLYELDVETRTACES